MSITITNGTTTTTPTLVLGFEATNASLNVIHQPIGRSNPDITLRATALRSGTLQLFYSSYTDANTARTMLAGMTTFTFTSTSPSISFTFAAAGNVTLASNDETDDTWLVTVDYQEFTS